ncbi:MULTISPECIES: hypothetical protein [Pandoraea]|uniref:Uncharacterized protein n=2 Tax=Pandoraea TaxID=93217 RepID=A0A5E4XM90_9BURK|nr:MULTISPECIES: hypothetical protein [Pandoraea]VVE14522.1 hypothetical protein PCE31107_02818 [Pandoraea cepalis]VVE37393.1 hypothetical protein PTE31013_04002 [Pandoraea terrigena]
MKTTLYSELSGRQLEQAYALCADPKTIDEYRFVIADDGMVVRRERSDGAEILVQVGNSLIRPSAVQAIESRSLSFGCDVFLATAGGQSEKVFVADLNPSEIAAKLRLA